METYAKHRPTPFDSNINIDDEDEKRGHWLVAPVSITRDTDDQLVLSNWHVFQEELTAVDPDGEDHEVHRFGHWGPGWYEIILIRPDTAAAKKAEELESRLEGYPVLDESDWSEREHEDQEQQWKDWGRYEFKRALSEHFDNADNWPDEALDWLAYEMTNAGLCEYPYTSGNDVHFECIDKADKVTRELAAKALRSARKKAA